MAGELLVCSYDLFKPFDIDPVELNDRIISVVKARKLVPDDYIPKVYTWMNNNTIKLSIYIMKRTRIVVDIKYDELKNTSWPPDEYVMNKVRKATNEYIEDSGYFTQGHMHLGNDDMVDAFRYALPYIDFRKENETMNETMKNISIADISFSKKRAEIVDEYAAKIRELQTERDLKIKDLEKEHDEDQYIEQMREAAFRHKTKKDALCEAGFSEEEAMMIVMEDFRSH